MRESAHTRACKSYEFTPGRPRPSFDRSRQGIFLLARTQRLTDEADRRAAVDALIREAEDCDADAIVGLDFEVEGIRSADVEGIPLHRNAATGIAVKFAQAA